MPSLSRPASEALILALDTSSSLGSVALSRGSAVIAARAFGEGKSHSQLLLPAMIELFESQKLRIEDVDLFTVVVGPGSFTGLRVSLANIRGIAGQKPCFGAIVTDVLAFGGRDRGAPLVALSDLFHGEVFGAVHDREGKLVSKREAGLLDPVLDALGSDLGATPAFIGSAALRHRESLARRFPAATFIEIDDSLAAHLARFAAANASDRNLSAADDLLPFYLRDPVNPGMKLGPPKVK